MSDQALDNLLRCPWPKQDPLYISYHDKEWGVSEYDDRGLYEKLVLDSFQAGLSWITILRKREKSPPLDKRVKLVDKRVKDKMRGAK